MQVYKEYRNFMINKYREDLKRRLTFTECRKLLAGKIAYPRFDVRTSYATRSTS